MRVFVGVFVDAVAGVAIAVPGAQPGHFGTYGTKPEGDERAAAPPAAAAVEVVELGDSRGPCLAMAAVWWVVLFRGLGYAFALAVCTC